MRKIINHLRALCVLFFAAVVGISGVAFADHPTYHAPDFHYGEDRPLHKAANHDEVAKAARLIEEGAGVNLKHNDYVFGWTPLHKAAIHSHVAMMNLLIGKGGDIEARDKEGRTPLYLAAQFGDPRVVEALLKAGANHEVRGPQGQAILHVAALNRHNAAWILSMLFPLYKKPMIRDSNDNTVLHYAASNEDGRASLFAIKEIYSRMLNPDENLWGNDARPGQWRHIELKDLRNKQGNTAYDQGAWMHDQSKKYDKRPICEHFLRIFNGCEPQRPGEILRLLEPRGDCYKGAGCGFKFR